MALYYSASSTQQVMPVGATDPGTYYISMQPVTNGRTNSHYAGANITYNASTGSLKLGTVNVNMLNVNTITVNGTTGAPGQFLTTSSSGLQYATPSAIANGLSNVTIGTTNGSITMGAGGGPGLTYDVSGNLTIGGNLTVLGTTTTIGNASAVLTGATGTFTTSVTTPTVTATTVNAATIGNASAVLYGTLNSSSANQPNITTLAGVTSIGASGVTTTAAGNFTITGSLTVNGTTTTINNTTYETTEYVTTINATNVNAATIGNSGAVLYGTLNSSSASQPNITTLAGVTSIGASGSTTLTGTLQTAAQPNITTLAGVTSIGASGSTTLTGTLQTAAQTNVTSLGTLTGLTTGTILPSGNLTVNLGSTTAWFNNIYGTAVHALYADLAENYQADRFYMPGTVVQFGGAAEVTIAEADTTRVAGVISTNPATLMNAALNGANVVAVALTGRVPCMVIGPVAKGDIMVSAGFGYARVNNTPAPGQAIGKALEDFVSQAKGVIEVVVGKI